MVSLRNGFAMADVHGFADDEGEEDQVATLREVLRLGPTLGGLKDGVQSPESQYLKKKNNILYTSVVSILGIPQKSALTEKT